MSEMHQQEGHSFILGWDWGSTAIRVSLLDCQDDKSLPREVWNSRSVPLNDEHYQKGAFNATLYLDGEAAPYAGEEYDVSRTPVPSKVFFCDNPTTGNAKIDADLQKQGLGKRILERVKEGMEEIVRTVLTEVENSLEKLRLENGGDCDVPYYIGQIGLSYPAYWTSKERNVYENLLRRIMPEFATLLRGDVRLDFHVESLASAHYFFRNQFHVNNVLGAPNTPTLVVFLDFGGHTLNGCLFFVLRRDRADKSKKAPISYYRVGETFCTSGGTQLWEQEFAKFAAKHLEGHNAGPETWHEVLELFHRQIKSFKSSSVSPISVSVVIEDRQDPSKTESVHVWLSLEQASECFWKGLKQPVDLATDKINEAASLSGNVQVILCGGSGKNKVVQSHIAEVCKAAGIAEPYLFYEAAGEKDSWNIANGAAIATSKYLSGRQFMKQGAAFGFQQGYVKNTKKHQHLGSSEDGVVLWDEEVPLAADGETSKPHKSHFTQNNRIRIICDPFLQANTRETKLTVQACYDIIELPPLPNKGYWKHTLSVVPSGDDIALSVKREYFGHAKAATRPRSTETFPPFPMGFNNSCNCFVLETNVDDENRSLMYSEEGELRPCPRESVQEQVRSMQNQARKTVAMRRPRTPTSDSESGGGRKHRRVKPSGHLREFQPRLPPPIRGAGSTIWNSVSRHQVVHVADAEAEDEDDQDYIYVTSELERKKEQLSSTMSPASSAQTRGSTRKPRRRGYAGLRRGRILDSEDELELLA